MNFFGVASNRFTGFIRLYLCPLHHTVKPAPGRNRENFQEYIRVHNLAIPLFFLELEQAIAQFNLCCGFLSSDAAAMALLSAGNSASAGLCCAWGGHRPTSPF